jgi:Spy/CpxP family protein refolding chaperone
MVTLMSAAAAAAAAAAAPAPHLPQQPMVAAAKHFVPHSLQMLILKVMHQAHLLLLLLLLLVAT